MQATLNTLTVKQFKKQGEGCLGYLVAAGTKAAIIDPRHDQVEEYLGYLKQHKLTLAFVIDTHTHADHLSGAAALKQATGAKYAMLKGTLVKAADTAVNDGDTLNVGDVEIKVIASPGHTPDSISLLAGENLFTGDTMLIGGSGRTDFMGGDANALFDSFLKFSPLPDATVVWPGHDYEGRTHTTLGAERKQNLVFTQPRAAVVAKLSARGPLPANMAEIITFNRKGEDPGRHVDVHAAKDLLASGATFLDVRSPLEFAGEWIDGAWNIPLPELEARIHELDKSKAPVVVLCRTGNRSLMAAQVLQRRGFNDFRILDGGVTAWRKAGLPLKEGKKRLSIERQTMLGAGSLVLLGVLLGTFVNPWFYALSGFVGGGLMLAGATGFCGMALILMKMPWNQLPQSTGGGSGGSCTVGGGSGGSCTVGGGCGTTTA